jgi:hypothetical protein
VGGNRVESSEGNEHIGAGNETKRLEQVNEFKVPRIGSWVINQRYTMYGRLGGHSFHFVDLAVF